MYVTDSVNSCYFEEGAVGGNGSCMRVVKHCDAAWIMNIPCLENNLDERVIKEGS